MQGMAALGVPNTKVFFEVTKIEDAVNLWRAIQVGDVQPVQPTRAGRAGDAPLVSLQSKQQGQAVVRPGAVEEFEDADGNVYDKETFELLKKQGII